MPNLPCHRCKLECCTDRHRATDISVTGKGHKEYLGTRNGAYTLCASCGAALLDFLDGIGLDEEYQHDCNISCAVGDHEDATPE